MFIKSRLDHTLRNKDICEGHTGTLISPTASSRGKATEHEASAGRPGLPGPEPSGRPPRDSLHAGGAPQKR